MTKVETGDAPAIPGCQDKDTLFLVTSVTWGLDGGPGSSFSSWFFMTITPPDSEQIHGKKATLNNENYTCKFSVHKIHGIITPSCTFDFQESTPWCFTAGAGSHTCVDPRVWKLAYSRIHMHIWIKANTHTNRINTQSSMTPLITLSVKGSFNFTHSESSSNDWIHVIFLLLKHWKNDGATSWASLVLAKLCVICECLKVLTLIS